jgi:hypothetical protein
LVVPDRQAAQRAWRKLQGLPANRTAPGEPLLVSLRDLVKLSDAEFAKLPALTSSQHAAALSAEDLAAFMAGLEQHPAWQQLMSKAQHLSGELAGKLPARLRPGVGGKAEPKAA